MVRFRPNWAQEELFNNLWYRNTICLLYTSQGGLYVPSKGGIFGTAFAGNDGMDKLELLAENVVPVISP